MRSPESAWLAGFHPEVDRRIDVEAVDPVGPPRRRLGPGDERARAVRKELRGVEISRAGVLAARETEPRSRIRVVRARTPRGEPRGLRRDRGPSGRDHRASGARESRREEEEGERASDRRHAAEPTGRAPEGVPFFCTTGPGPCNARPVGATRYAMFDSRRRA